MINEILKNIGLNGKEIAVYTSLLKSNNLPVSLIAKKSKIKRTTCYKIINDLIGKGFLSSYKKGSITYLIAEKPESIIKLLEGKQRKIENQKRLLSKNIEVFELDKNEQSKRPLVKFFEGTSGLKQAYESTLKSKENIRAYANIEEMHKGLPDFFPEYYQRRKNAKIFINTICPDNKKSLERHLKDKREFREIRFIDVKKYNFIPEMNVYEDKVLFASWSEKIAVVIESKEIANLHKKIFDALWDKLKSKNTPNA